MSIADINHIEKVLSDRQWMSGGQLPTSEDREVYDSLKGASVSSESHPNAFSWMVLVSKFSESARNAWPVGQTQKPQKLDQKSSKKT